MIGHILAGPLHPRELTPGKGLALFILLLVCGTCMYLLLRKR